MRNFLRNRLMCEGTEFIALYAGRLSKEKRIELLFPSLPSNVTLVIVGDGPDKQKLEKYEKQHKNVRMVAEMVPQGVLRKYYKAADLLVSASNSETYGMAVRESLHCRTPVVVQNDGGFIEQVRPFIDGFLVDFSDAEKAKSTIIKACGMLERFQPCPQHNDVVDLPDFIINGDYHKITPYSRVKNKTLYYLLTVCVQPLLVFMYHFVSFFLSLFGTLPQM